MFITQSYFSVPKDVRLNLTHYLIMKINKKRKLENIARSHLADIDYKDFVKIYREFTKEPFSFLTIDTTLPAKISGLSSKHLLDKYEYLTAEDLRYEPSVFEKVISPLRMSFSKISKKDEVKSVTKSKSRFNYDSKHTFYRFYKVWLQTV